jgi:hypothetical protein
MRRALLAAVTGLVLAAPSAQAAQLTVTTTADAPGVCADGACPTLRAALDTSAGTPEADSVQLPAGDYALTSDLPVPAGVTITGASARTTTLRGAALDVTGDVSIAHVTIGGGVVNDGALTLDRVHASGGIVNHASLTLTRGLVDVGGISNTGSLTASDGTITGTTGPAISGTGTGTLTRMTIVRNASLNLGTMHVQGSLLDACGPPGPTSDGGNVVPTGCAFAAAGDVTSDDPKLATALANAGGETDVLRIAPGSPAVGVAGACTGVTDQRELSRPQGAACDAGAYELEVVQLTGPQGLTRETPVAFSFTAAPGSDFRCALDGAALTPCTSPTSHPGLADGDHTFTVQAFAGNDAVSDPATRTFTLDTTPPPAPAVSGDSDGFTLTSESGAAFSCSLDGGAFASCASGVSYPELGDGEHVLVVRATGAAGNSSTTEHRFTVARVPASTPAPAPMAGPAPTPTPTPIATPAYRKTVVLRPQAGRTLIRRRGDAAFSEIRARTAVAVGTIVDVKQGAVIVIAATARSSETAKFSGGVFTAGGTDLMLSEKLRCGRARRLTGDGAGAFRIVGRFAAATGRGAKWTVEDTCKQTRISVARGVVAIRDNRRTKTVLIRSGKSYTARPKR